MKQLNLAAACQVVMGQAPDGESYNRDGVGMPLVAGAGDFGETYPVVSKFTTAPGKTCEAGDILLGIRATIGEKVIADRQYCVGRGVAALRPRLGLDRRFLWHWLTHATPDLQRSARGATFKQVTRSDVSELKMLMPPLAEQRRIADILDRADAMRAKRRDAIAFLDTLAKSIFDSMFADAELRWPAATVADVVSASEGSIRTGPFGSQLLHSEFTQGGVAVLGIDNAVDNKFAWRARRFISERKYQSLRRYTVRPGDVLITIMGTCGRCAVVPQDIPVAINTKHLCCITLDRSLCLPEFLHAYFLGHASARRYFGQKAKGAIMSGLNMGIIKSMPVPLVPVAVQQKFVELVAAVDRLQVAQLASLGEMDALFASLQHRAFRGEL